MHSLKGVPMFPAQIAFNPIDSNDVQEMSQLCFSISSGYTNDSRINKITEKSISLMTLYAFSAIILHLIQLIRTTYNKRAQFASSSSKWSPS